MHGRQQQQRGVGVDAHTASASASSTSSGDRPPTSGSGRVPQPAQPVMAPQANQHATKQAHEQRQQRRRAATPNVNAPGQQRAAGGPPPACRHAEQAGEQRAQRERQRARQRPQRPAAGPQAPAACAREAVDAGSERRQDQHHDQQADGPRGHRLALQRQPRSGARWARPGRRRARRPRSAPRARGASSRSALTGSLRDGPRSPDTWTSTAGTPSRSSTPCSPTASGNIRCASWPSALGGAAFDPGLVADRVLDGALQLQRRRAEPVGERDHERAAHRRPRRGRRARSPRRAGRGQLAGSAAAPASPPLPPLVETSTIVRWVARGGEHARELEQGGGARQFRRRAGARRRRGGRRSRSASRRWSRARRAITIRAASASPSIVWRVEVCRRARRSPPPAAPPSALRVFRHVRASARRRRSRAAVRGSAPRARAVRRARAGPRRLPAPASTERLRDAAAERERRDRRARAGTARTPRDRGVR